MNYVEAGKRIKLLREQKNKSQTDLAKATGLTPSFIDMIENGKTQALNDLDVIVEIAMALDTSLEYIARGIEGKESIRRSFLKNLNIQ